MTSIATAAASAAWPRGMPLSASNSPRGMGRLYPSLLFCHVFTPTSFYFDSIVLILRRDLSGEESRAWLRSSSPLRSWTQRVNYSSHWQ